MTTVLDRLADLTADTGDQVTVTVRIDKTAAELRAENQNGNRDTFSDRWKGYNGLVTHATVYSDPELAMRGKSVTFTNAKSKTELGDLVGYKLSEDEVVIKYDLRHAETGMQAFFYHPKELDWAKVTIKFVGKGTK